MERVIRKTRKEIDLDESSTSEIVVGGEKCFYWFVVCDSCNTAFFKGEKILSTKDNVWKCPNLVRNYIFWRRKCMNHLSGGDRDCFNKYYKLAAPIK